MPVPVDANGKAYMQVGPQMMTMPPYVVPYSLYGHPYWYAQMAQMNAMRAQQYWIEQQKMQQQSMEGPVSGDTRGELECQPEERQERRSSPVSEQKVTKRVADENEEAKFKVTKTEWPKPAEIYAKKTPATQSTSTPATTDQATPQATKTSVDEKKQSQSSSNAPPPNAPTGPKALQQSKPKQVKPQAVIPLPKSNPTESGSWSQSRRWVSQETKERMAFHKMKLNLHHIRADDSPFVPQSPAALAALRLEGDKRRLAREVEKREGKSHKQRGNALRLFGGKTIGDRLSPVLAWDHCFTQG